MGKLAILVTCKKVLEVGQKQFSNDPYISVADLYQVKSDQLLGFTIKQIGTLHSEKVQELYFSSVGNIFCTIDKDSATRFSLNFFMINRISNEGQTNTAVTQITAKGSKITGEKKIAAVEDTYEFRKTARYDILDKKWIAKWDEEGRYFVLYGKKSSNFDKAAKNVKFFNMFGELLQMFSDV